MNNSSPQLDGRKPDRKSTATGGGLSLVNCGRRLHGERKLSVLRIPVSHFHLIYVCS